MICGKIRADFAFYCCFALLIIGLILNAACSSGGKAQTNISNGIPVTVTQVIQKDVPLELRSIGTVQAVSSVLVKA